MNRLIASLTHLLGEVILPSLKAIQTSQAEQMAANERLENAIEELHLHLDSHFAHLSAQLTACRAELAATQAVFKAVNVENGTLPPDSTTLMN
jgi:hypothetical protein